MVITLTNATFSSTIRITLNAVSIFLLYDPYAPSDSQHHQALDLMEKADLHYTKYGLGLFTFFKGDVYDRTMVENDIKNVQCTPSFYFYVGDGSTYKEYYRLPRIITFFRVKFQHFGSHSSRLLSERKLLQLLLPNRGVMTFSGQT